MRLKPGARAGDPNAHRSRTETARGGRAFVRAVMGRAAPRVYTTGQSVSQSSGGSGSGNAFIGSLGNVDGGTIINIGNPLTGARTAMWGFFCWASTADVWGS